jgi:hypothetical protein
VSQPSPGPPCGGGAPRPQRACRRSGCICRPRLAESGRHRLELIDENSLSPGRQRPERIAPRPRSTPGWW